MAPEPFAFRWSYPTFSRFAKLDSRRLTPWPSLNATVTSKSPDADGAQLITIPSPNVRCRTLSPVA